MGVALTRLVARSYCILLREVNALTGTPLARLRCRDRWLAQTQALSDGVSITKAALQLGVARGTAFHWRHRILALAQANEAASLDGDDTEWHELSTAHFDRADAAKTANRLICRLLQTSADRLCRAGHDRLMNG